MKYAKVVYDRTKETEEYGIIGVKFGTQFIPKEFIEELYSMIHKNDKEKDNER